MASRKSWKLWSSGHPLSYIMQFGGNHLVTAQKMRDGRWFWYTVDEQMPSCNTSSRPVATFDDVKIEVARFCRDHKV